MLFFLTSLERCKILLWVKAVPPAYFSDDYVIITMKFERHSASCSKQILSNKVRINALMVKFQLFSCCAYQRNHIFWLDMFPCVIAFIFTQEFVCDAAIL